MRQKLKKKKNQTTAIIKTLMAKFFKKLFCVGIIFYTYTRAEVFRASFDEVDEASAAIELGQEESGIGLRIRGFDPLKARSNGAVIAATFAQDPAAIAAHPHGFCCPVALRFRYIEKQRRCGCTEMKRGE